jgi:hypothetical protein
MEVLGLLHIKNNQYRKIMEKKLIAKLGTAYPLGMNIMEN